MDTSPADRIAADPNYQLLKATRLRFGWMLTIAMLVVYYGFILLIAFRKDVLAVRLGEGVMTWGVPIGFGVIVLIKRSYGVVRPASLMRLVNWLDDPPPEKRFQSAGPVPPAISKSMPTTNPVLRVPMML